MKITFTLIHADAFGRVEQKQFNNHKEIYNYLQKQSGVFCYSVYCHLPNTEQMLEAINAGKEVNNGK